MFNFKKIIMKLLKTLVFVVAAGLMVTAYGQDAKKLTPSDVVNKFYEAALTFDFANAKEYVSKNFQEAYGEMVAKLEAPEVKEQLEVMKELTKDAKIEIVSEDIDEDNAVVTVKIIMAEEEREDVIILIKEDDNWKINENRVL